MLEKAGLNPDTILNTSYNFERVPYCSIPLPQPKQMLPEDSEVAQRLFIVCQPSGIPDKVLRDAFCRMGNLIDVYLLPGEWSLTKGVGGGKGGGAHVMTPDKVPIRSVGWTFLLMCYF